MITDNEIKPLFDLTPWKDRGNELKEMNVTGVCFYCDGGVRPVAFKSRAGYGIHAYFYNNDKPQGLGGFKLDHPTKMGYVEKKLAQKDEVVNVVKFCNIYGNINGVTSPVAELIAFVQSGLLFLEAKMYEWCKTLVIRTDSELVVKGVNEYLSVWKKNEWKKSDGRQVKNIQYWKKVDEIIQTAISLGVKVSIEHIYGHRFNTGNNIADQMATLGLYQDQPYGDEWVSREDFNASSVEFCPLLLESKLLYYPSRTVVSAFDKRHYHYVYSNNNSQNDVNEIGRNLVDSSIGIVITDSEDQGISTLYRSCAVLDKALNATPKVIDLNIATKPGVQIEVNESNIAALPREVDKRDIRIMTTSEKIALVVLDPPRNSLGTLSNINDLLDIYRRFEAGDEYFKSVDITDQLFDKEVNGKGVVKYKFKVTEAFHIDVLLPVWNETKERHIRTPLTFGLDLPKRRVFSNIKHLNPVVKAFTWYENDKISYFATVVYVDGAVGVWCAELTNSIITEELKHEF